MDPGSSSCLFPTSPPPYNSMTVSFDQLKEETDTHNNDGGVPLCRVCERGYDGSQHFGVEVCRACAAFFRRAIEGRKKFVCRKGGDSCQLNVVQCKRPAIRENLSSYSPDVPSTSGEIMPFRANLDISGDGSSSFHGTIFRPIPTVNPVYSTASSKPNLIYRVLQNYRKMYDERWVMELEIPGGEDAPTYNAAGKVLSSSDIQ
ncbi:hypothetical protein RB195_001763 [Necator americanus]|uniref:Nuclear receptor domain-containing protein n=1 Tax=Necator americanus TaxID=51031 RepID=A0ABR1DGZ1_NECAM